MEQINNITENKHSVVAVGNFDGVHNGHRLVFLKTIEIAATENLNSVALTFIPHPKNYFNPAHPVGIITDDEYKAELIKNIGIKYVFFQQFNSDFASMNCQQFTEYLQYKLSCSHIVCGEGSKFGNHAAYGTDDLEKECEKLGMKLTTVSVNPSFSSSQIREAIVSGNVKKAAELMGRPFSFASAVLNGKKLGSKIGFPTINQKLNSDSVIPRFGVYSGFIIIDGIRYRCIVNIGCRPTVNSDKSDVDCETFIFDFSEDLYGKKPRVFLTSFIRDEKKFDNISDLKEQINKDCRFVIENGI